MIEDLRGLPAGEAIESDVCVVGAGPTALALAHELAAVPGLRVVMLESGGLRLDAEAQRQSEGVEVCGMPHKGNGPSGRGRAFGGTGRLWAGQCLPLDPIDFEARPWVPHSGWPFDAAALAPYIGRAEAFFGVRGQAYDERNFERFGLKPPRWSADALRNMFTVYAPRIDVGAAWAKAFERLHSVRVLLHAVAVGIETEEGGGRATGVRVLAPDGGRDRIVRARFVALCAGAIENARLLLMSKGAGPAGLGNGHDLVGRFFQEHPHAVTAALEAEEAADLADLQTRFRLLYGKGGLRFFPKFALAEARQRAAQVLNCNAHLIFDYPDESGVAVLQEFLRAARSRRLPPSALRQAARLPGAVGEAGRTLVRRYTKGFSPLGRPERVRLQVYLEQAPNAESRVSLAPGARDSLGLPAMRLHWQVTELERRTLQVITETVREEFERLGLGRMRPAPWLSDPGANWRSELNDCSHHIGTTRMAAAPREGVVDPDCGVFGVEGLFVAGGSVFPTSGYANPTLTMVALAVRLADHLRASLEGTARLQRYG